LKGCTTRQARSLNEGLRYTSGEQPEGLRYTSRMKPVIVISNRDNVATALEALSAGRELSIGGGVTVREPIPPGHKIALRPIAAGEAVVKYGSPIGTARVAIDAGQHVHVHNVDSARGRGDLR
jgi:altronate dehydratase